MKTTANETLAIEEKSILAAFASTPKHLRVSVVHLDERVQAVAIKLERLGLVRFVNGTVEAV